MPLFEFVCHECEAEFETLVRTNETPVCPSCSSNRLEKLMSVSASHAGRAGSPLPLAGGCPPPEAGPCSPMCCRLPQN